MTVGNLNDDGTGLARSLSQAEGIVHATPTGMAAHPGLPLPAELLRADHPALGLYLDSFHVISRGSDPAGIRIIPGSKLFFVQLADAPQLHMDVLQWSRHHRLFPGQGSFDLVNFVGQVLSTGYDGPLSLEVFNDVFRQADPRRAAVDAMRSLLTLQEQEEVSASGPGKPANTSGSPTCHRHRSSPGTPPPN